MKLINLIIIGAVASQEAGFQCIWDCSVNPQIYQNYNAMQSCVAGCNEKNPNQVSTITEATASTSLVESGIQATNSDVKTAPTQEAPKPDGANAGKVESTSVVSPQGSDKPSGSNLGEKPQNTGSVKLSSVPSGSSQVSGTSSGAIKPSADKPSGSSTASGSTSPTDKPKSVSQASTSSSGSSSRSSSRQSSSSSMDSEESSALTISTSGLSIILMLVGFYAL